ncbi:MAG: hypothetical protein KJP04_08230, partial [Arenicella sp.]|nr:hypothetical protein [Arenicella sp.]
MAAGGETPREVVYPVYPPAPASQTQVSADSKSSGCLTCHTATDQHTMHSNPGVILGCTDCHGGDATITDPDYDGHGATIAHQSDGMAHEGDHAVEKTSYDDNEHSDEHANDDHGGGYKSYPPQYRSA